MKTELRTIPYTHDIYKISQDGQTLWSTARERKLKPLKNPKSVGSIAYQLVLPEGYLTICADVLTALAWGEDAILTSTRAW